MKNYYDVLKLEKTCTSKEIKDSFIKLSKEYHPDKNKSKDAHKKFVEVNEAYSVLGKSNSRAQYDNTLSYEKAAEQFRHGQNPTVNVRTPYEYYRDMYARNLNKNQEHAGSRAYFTTKKINMFIFCCLLMMIGSGLQLKAVMYRRDKRSQELAQYLKESRERKKNLTKEEKIKEWQFRFHKKRLENASPEK